MSLVATIGQWVPIRLLSRFAGLVSPQMCVPPRRSRGTFFGGRLKVW